MTYCSFFFLIYILPPQECVKHTTLAPEKKPLFVLMDSLSESSVLSCRTHQPHSPFMHLDGAQIWCDLLQKLWMRRQGFSTLLFRGRRMNADKNAVLKTWYFVHWPSDGICFHSDFQATFFFFFTAARQCIMLLLNTVAFQQTGVTFLNTGLTPRST